MKWDDLQYVAAVAEHGSLSAAARSLGVNHATVQRRIAAFEDCHQVQIFEKKPSGYKLNASSRDFLDDLKAVQAGIQGLERSISAGGTPYQGTVTVTSTDTMCQYVLVPQITAIRKLYPELNIRLLSTNRRLDLGQLDAEISIRPALSIGDDLVGIDSGPMILEAYATPEYWNKNKSPDPNDHTWIGAIGAIDQSPPAKWLANRPGSRIVFPSDSFLTMKLFAEQGEGIGIMPGFLCSRDSTLVKSETLTVRLETRVWVTAHKDLAATPRIRALMAHFSNALSVQAPDFISD